MILRLFRDNSGILRILRARRKLMALSFYDSDEMHRLLHWTRERTPANGGSARCCRAGSFTYQRHTSGSIDYVSMDG